MHGSMFPLVTSMKTRSRLLTPEMICLDAAVNIHQLLCLEFFTELCLGWEPEPPPSPPSYLTSEGRLGAVSPSGSVDKGQRVVSWLDTMNWMK